MTSTLKLNLDFLGYKTIFVLLGFLVLCFVAPHPPSSKKKKTQQKKKIALYFQAVPIPVAERLSLCVYEDTWTKNLFYTSLTFWKGRCYVMDVMDYI